MPGQNLKQLNLYMGPSTVICSHMVSTSCNLDEARVKIYGPKWISTEVPINMFMFRWVPSLFHIVDMTLEASESVDLQ